MNERDQRTHAAENLVAEDMHERAPGEVHVLIVMTDGVGHSAFVRMQMDPRAAALPFKTIGPQYFEPAWVALQVELGRLKGDQ